MAKKKTKADQIVDLGAEVISLKNKVRVLEKEGDGLVTLVQNKSDALVRVVEENKELKKEISHLKFVDEVNTQTQRQHRKNESSLIRILDRVTQ
jgi:hypothetical protein